MNSSSILRGIRLYCLRLVFARRVWIPFDDAILPFQNKKEEIKHNGRKNDDPMSVRSVRHTRTGTDLCLSY